MNSVIPHVQIDGRHVTVTFEMPFIEGDVCITPRHGQKTTVNMVPDVRIEMRNNLRDVQAFFGGAWYSADHTQMHGVGEFLPDMDAFLSYSLRQTHEVFENSFTWLLGKFAGRPDAIAALTARRVELKASEIATAKAEMAATTLASAHRINALEAELADLQGAAS